MEYFDKVEFASCEEITAMQLVRLRNTLERAARSPFYAAKFKESGVSADSIKNLDDIRRLPFTTKDDLRAAYPCGMLAMPMEKMVRLHASSGTTGAPTVVMQTQNDLNSWADLMARCMYMVGLRPADVFQNTSGYGLFTGGLGIHYGAERLGCLTIPAAAGNSQRQLKLIQDFKVTGLHIIPSYALYFSDFCKNHGINAADLTPRIALIGAEPHTEESRKRIEKLLGLKAYNSYGLSEMNGPGVAFECKEQNGLHLWEDSYILEILNPETQEPVAEGEVGELVLTTLCREGMPIIRYRTRDLSRLITGPCPCGRLHRRIDRILGRVDDMIIIKGVNIYPMQVERILLSIPEVGQNYLIVLERENYIDQIKVKVEIKEDYFIEDMRALQAIQKKITAKLRDEILVTPRVELVEQNTLPKSQGKAERVQDLRESREL